MAACGVSGACAAAHRVGRRACELRCVRRGSSSARLCAAPTCSVPASTEREWSALAVELRGAARSPEALRAVVAERRGALTTSFLSWLGDQAERADATEAAELEELGGRVCALCDSLDGSGFAEQLAGAAQGQLRALGALSAAGQPGLALSEHLDAQQQQLKARWAALALRGEQHADAQRGANASARRTSAAELLGRSPLLSPPALHAATRARPEERILAVLLCVEDEQARLEAVAEALTAPVGGSALEDDGLGDELLFTTPPRLLQAIDSAMARLARGEPSALDAAQYLPAAVAPPASARALQFLRDAVLAHLD